MSVTDALGQRMKTYEAVSQHYLMRRTPVIIRVDMKAGHTFTKYLNRPWDSIFQKSMHETMKFMCENIQNCVFGYAQSDEITLVLTDYETLTTDAWFSYRTDKLCSISASMATLKFNQAFADNASKWCDDFWEAWNRSKEEADYFNTLNECVRKGAMFDARCFNIPKEEVTNLVYWRQVDAVRNSIQSMGQAYFSHKQLMNKNTKEVRQMLEDNGTLWEDRPVAERRGVACLKGEDGWYIDYNIPTLKGEDRDYVEKLI